MTSRQQTALPDREIILARLKQLTPQQQAEVMDFIDFLGTRPSGSPLEQHLRAAATSEVDLQDVRRRLANMTGSMSDTVRRLRDERG